MKIYLIYNQFFDDYGKERKIGGVETYMEALCNLFSKKGEESIICQFSKIPFKKDLGKYKVCGFVAKTSSELYKQLVKDIKKDDLIIFMNEVFALNVNQCKTINIQHGNYWDNPYTKGNIFIKFLRRIVIILRALVYYNRCKYHVAVDYNWYNWYKVFILNRLPKNLFVIPNFANQIISDEELSNKLKTIQEPIKIIFARRFINYRGSLLFAKTAAKLLSKYSNLQITLAGEGPCKQEMETILAPYAKNVKFIKYLPNDSFSIHKQHDIAVVPTISCEGTSLSLLEAMAAGCLAVATPIGGMSNIILDGFNGFFAMPDEDSLYTVIGKAIQQVYNKEIQKNAVLSIRKSFSLSKWENSWWDFITFVRNN